MLLNNNIIPGYRKKKKKGFGRSDKNRPNNVWGIINAPQKQCNIPYNVILVTWSTGAYFRYGALI